MSIVLKNMSFSYGGNNLLDDISLSIKSGENVGLVGVSGGGKSTLLKLISGLYEVQTGQIDVMGACTAPQRRKKVAMVMQNALLLPASIRDNITCGHPMEVSDLLLACEGARLLEWIETLPDGLDTDVGERGNKVSGGQAQRIAIARAIAKNAPVILLDEPTSALDQDTSTALITALGRLTQGKTVLHVSHRLDMLEGCDRILLLEGGRVRDL